MTQQRPSSFALQSSIPVLRMLDEAATKEFYLNYLEYKADWEHRFRDETSSPLYMQIHQGDSVLHLNGHADSESPVAEVRIPVTGLADYCDYLRSKRTGDEQPELVDPRGEGRKTEMNLVDPSGNLIVFWSPRLAT